MSVTSFLEHLHDGSPAFRCYASGDRDEQLSLVAPLKHQLNASASSAALEDLRAWLGSEAAAFIALFSAHDGFTAYLDTRSDAAGLRLFPLREWKAQTAAMKNQFAATGVPSGYQPAGVHDALVFAEIPDSGNYFSVKTDGPDQGMIFYVDHDEFPEEPLAETIEEFLAGIASSPANFLNEMGCYARYSDGTTSIQWIPKEYSAE